MRDIIIVGSGIIGATVSAVLRKQGMDVLTLDDRRLLAGTTPSGGHLKPSWFGGMKKTDYEPAMELLDSTWELLAEEFKLWPTWVKTTVYRVNTDKVLLAPYTFATVQKIEHLDNYPVVRYLGGEERCRLLLVAAGAWCNQLLPQFNITAKRGVSYRFRKTLEEPFIKPWAPYKQIVAHQQSAEEVWVGDGTAILDKNWTDLIARKCLGRCRSALGLGRDLPLRTLEGLRPYTTNNGDPCLFTSVGPRAWIATGAGKMGTIAAGWVARRLLRMVAGK